MRGLRDRSFALLELGVWKGDSLAMWRDCFPGATIVGVDMLPPDLELGPRVTIVQGDQTDGELLARLRDEHAPDGFEVIIDDASHLGELSAESLAVLYTRHLRPGGLYFIEDWGTGYLTDWVDGGAPEAVIGTGRIADSVAALAEVRRRCAKAAEPRLRDGRARQAARRSHCERNTRRNGPRLSRRAARDRVDADSRRACDPQEAGRLIGRCYPTAIVRPTAVTVLQPQQRQMLELTGVQAPWPRSGARRPRTPDRHGGGQASGTYTNGNSLAISASVGAISSRCEGFSSAVGIGHSILIAGSSYLIPRSVAPA